MVDLLARDFAIFVDVQFSVDFFEFFDADSAICGREELGDLVFGGVLGIIDFLDTNHPVEGAGVAQGILKSKIEEDLLDLSPELGSRNLPFVVDVDHFEKRFCIVVSALHFLVASVT